MNPDKILSLRENSVMVNVQDGNDIKNKKVLPKPVQCPVFLFI